MTKPLHQLYLLLPLALITWWTLTLGFKTITHTDNASFAMTHINTEVLDIRADVSKEVAADGFEAVDDYAMEQAAAGDEAWKLGAYID